MLYPTLMHHYLQLTADRCPEKTAIICDNQRFSYQQLNGLSDSLARNLISMDLKTHDRVAVFMDNCPESAIAIYAISKAAATFVVLNGSLKAPKLAYILENSGAKFIISHTSKARIIAEALKNSDFDGKIILATPSGRLPPKLPFEAVLWNDLLENTPSTPDSTPESAIDTDLAALIYTSGSTGTPKGVMVPHINMLSVSKSILSYLKYDSDDVILNILPLSFGYGLYQVIMSTMVGATVILERSLVYLHDILEKFAKEKVTVFPFVPTIAAMILKLESIDTYDFSSIRCITNAGAALPVAHLRRLQQLMPAADIYSMYGLTECVRVSYLDPAQADIRPDSCGKPIPNCRIDILDEQGSRAPPDTVGQLVVTGSNVMPGYWRDPELTKKVFKQNHDRSVTTLYTGDLFRTDDEGYLYFVSRKDDMIKTRGERVSPLEVENILCQMGIVSEAAVIGVPHEIFGQAVKAFIVPTDTEKNCLKEISTYCAKNMENFMVPEYIEIVDKLPKTPNGKVDKKILR